MGWIPLRKHCINACSSESLRCAVLEDSPNPTLCLVFCVPCALQPTGMWEVQAFVGNERSRFILLGDLFSDSLDYCCNQRVIQTRPVEQAIQLATTQWPGATSVCCQRGGASPIRRIGLGISWGGVADAGRLNLGSGTGTAANRRLV